MKFKKKPVEIEAFQLTSSESIKAMPEDFQKAVQFIDYPSTTVFFIPTLEGVMDVSPGDWIIRGVKGEFYACKPDVFVMTYESCETAQWQDRPRPI